VGMVDPGRQTVMAIASSGMVNGYTEKLNIQLEDPRYSQGPAARCIHSGSHAIVNDIATNSSYLPWREEALQRGYRSSAAFPLNVDGKTVGVFNLYSTQVDFFVGAELSLLDEMAKDISFALEVNKREEERREAEKELRWRTAFFEAQVDSSPDGVLVVDNQGKKILQNQRLNELFKIPDDVAFVSDDNVQRHFVAGMVKDPDQFLERVEYLTSHPDEVSRDELELLDDKILDRYSAPVQDKLGNHYGRIWTFRDVTESHRLEDRLRQSQKMEAIGQLTGGIAHDFNNLLTVIMGCSEVLGNQLKENVKLRRMAEMILDAAIRGSELTHRMLAFARRQSLRPKPVNINRMLVDMEGFLRRTLSADIEMKIVQCPNGWHTEECEALVDPTQLESALLNLCVNARDAMPAGGKLIIEASRKDLDAEYASRNSEVTPGHYIELSVTDTGCGISKENLVRVFEPFFTTKGVGKGTGLGLSMVYGFVKQSRGHVVLYSEVGQGTTVSLYLPVASVKSEAPVAAAPSTTDMTGSEVILLVEDDTHVRELARTQLMDLGYLVYEAANAKVAMEMLQMHSDIDLLFTDIVMPGGLNGRELANEARKLYPELKVLYCSGYTENAILEQGLLREDMKLLKKPYTRLTMAASVREVLASGQER